MILLFLYIVCFEPVHKATLLQVWCTFCWLAQWEDLILVVEGDILQLYYFDCHIQRGDVLHSQNFLHLVFSLWDSRKSQNNFIQLAMVWLLLFLLRVSFGVSHHAQGWQELWLIIPSNKLHSFKSVVTVYAFKWLIPQFTHIRLTFTQSSGTSSSRPIMKTLDSRNFFNNLLLWAWVTDVKNWHHYHYLVL